MFELCALYKDNQSDAIENIQEDCLLPMKSDSCLANLHRELLSFMDVEKNPKRKTLNFGYLKLKHHPGGKTGHCKRLVNKAERIRKDMIANSTVDIG